MASQSSKSERTEKPTGKRKRDARKKGQVPRTRDLSQAASMAAVIGALVWTGSDGLTRVTGMMTDSFELMGDEPTEMVAGTMFGIVATGGLTLGYFCAPLALMVTVAVVMSQVVQGGWVFAPAALQPKFSQLNPAQGLKRLGASRGWIDMVKAMTIASAMAYFATKAVAGILQDGPRLAMLAPVDAAVAAWDGARALIWQAVIVLLIAALADYGLQRWRHAKSLRMTKREVRDDTRMVEGSPETKARIRRIQREVLPAPRVLAKGRNALARRIREIAREHGVPIIENKPLARALHAAVEIGEFIPAELFDAVAEVLVYLVRLKQLRL